MERTIEKLQARAEELQKELDEVNKELEAKISNRRQELWSAVVRSIIDYKKEMGLIRVVQTDDDEIEDVETYDDISCSSDTPGVFWI